MSATNFLEQKYFVSVIGTNLLNQNYLGNDKVNFLLYQKHIKFVEFCLNYDKV